jgi:DNA-binding response OmpR family regulator
MLTARGEVSDRVVGLEIGADDYLSKPFEPRELVARIQAVLRRGEPHAVRERIQVAGLEIDRARHEVHHRGKRLSLTSAEFDLLDVLVQHQGRVLSRDAIMARTHGVDWEAFDRSVDVLISRLRQKLGDDPRQPRFIRTVRGTGYQFVAGLEE